MKNRWKYLTVDMIGTVSVFVAGYFASLSDNGTDVTFSTSTWIVCLLVFALMKLVFVPKYIGIREVEST